METFSLLVAIGLAGTAFAMAPTQERQDLIDGRVSPQGMLVEGQGRTSPRGITRLQVMPIEGGLQTLVSTLRITDRNGSVHLLPRVRGNAFFVTDLESIVVLEAYDSNAVPTRMTVIDFDGRGLFTQRVRVMTDPSLSNDGQFLAYRSIEGVVVLDLDTFETTLHPLLDLFAAGPDGLLAGVLPGEGNVVTFLDGQSETAAVHLPARPIRMAFSEDGSALLLLTSRELLSVMLDSGRSRTLYRSPADRELRDLRVSPGQVTIGLRKIVRDRISGSVVVLTASGRVLGPSSGPGILPMSAPIPAVLVGSIPWPLTPNAQHPVGNTYAEYQNYGGGPYLHPGVDIFGADLQPVYAVRDGVVKAVLTTSGQYHWRVAIGDSGGAATVEGYLYAHLDLPSITVNVGDVVTQGQHLGDLVPWPVAGFTHTHFARIEDSGTQWNGSWLCTENPHLNLQNQSELQAPVFEPAVGADTFAFCVNQTSNYLDPGQLVGQVDIIAHVGDRIGTSYVCAVQELRYTIYPAGFPGSPVIDDKLAVFFDMDLDTYQNGPIDPFLVDLFYKQDSTCDTRGDYGSREFFHILTNSNGDQVYEASDMQEAWDTVPLPDGDYVIEVTATDVAGNSTTASMIVTTKNH